MGAYIITNSELIAIANAIRNKNSSDETFILEQIPNAIATIGQNIGSGAIVRNANNDKYIINDVKLINIANAIRNKLNISDKITIANMPNLINNIQTNYTINYYNGKTLLKSEEVIAGTDAIYSGTTPTKSQDAQYTYTFAGWSKDDDNTVDADALTNVVSDRNVYACFTGTLRKYSVYFVKASADGGGTLQTINNVIYGTTITAASSYTGSTPTTTQGDATDYPFEGWNPASATVTGDTTFTAKFGSPIEVAEISDSWDTIIANIDNGTYSTKYKIGNYKPLDLGTDYGTVNMQIVAMDEDELADGSGTAPLTFLSMSAIPESQLSYGSGGWENSNIRTTYLPGIKENILSGVKSRVLLVSKSQRLNKELKTQNDTLWVPSLWELGIEDTYEQTQISYSSIFKNDSDRATSGIKYYTRTSRYGDSYIDIIVGNGKEYWTNSTSYGTGIRFGFCLGLEPETITDSWETILANTNKATEYNKGDTKYLDLGTEGKQLMEIVAFDTDDKADGTGKAGITWISKDLLYNPHTMNNESVVEVNWRDSDLRTYIKSFKTHLPSALQSGIVEVTKVSSTYENGAIVVNGQTTTDDLWIPSNHEVGFGTDCESIGAVYDDRFSTSDDRIKFRYSASITGISVCQSWSLRSAHKAKYFKQVTSTGNTGSKNNISNNSIAIGFCTN